MERGCQRAAASDWVVWCWRNERLGVIRRRRGTRNSNALGVDAGVAWGYAMMHIRCTKAEIIAIKVIKGDINGYSYISSNKI